MKQLKVTWKVALLYPIFFLQWQSYFTVLHMNAADELTVYFIFQIKN